MKLSKDVYFPWGIAAFGFLVHLGLFWPGMLSADSYTQLSQAQSGVFGNHHPVLMSLVWFYFNEIIPGPGLMLILHLSFLWSAIGLFAYTLHKSRIKSWWWFYIIPLWPVFLCYSSMIWKDVGFAFSYLFAISILFYCTFENKRPNIPQIALIILLLGYGAGTKYQALYLLPFCAFWLSYLFFNQKRTVVSLLPTIIITAGIFYTNKIIDQAFVAPSHQSNAWQMARLYDLAGMSVHEDRPLFPDYIYKNPHFSMEKLKKLYSFQNVDSLMYAQNPTLISTSNPDELARLWDTWKKAVIAHPLSYAWHRSGLWLKLVNKNITDYYYYISHETKNLTLKGITVPFLKTYLLFFPSLFLRFYWVIPIFFFALYISRRKEIDPKLKFVYRMLSTIALAQLLVYFFLSMASDLRYLLLSNLLAFFLIPVLKICHHTSDGLTQTKTHSM